MQLHTLESATSRTKARRIGRGGKRGKTSGRGHKGQKSRAGHKIRPVERDMIKKLPKLRGHGKNRSRTINPDKIRPIAVNLATIEKHFTAGERVDPNTLVAKKLIRRESGRAPAVKILAKGTISVAVTVAKCTLSETARTAIEKVGGKVL